MTRGAFASEPFAPRASWAAAILIATMAVPSIAYMRGAGSMAAGTSAVCLGLLLLSLMAGVHLRPWLGERGAAVAALAAIAIVSLWSGLSLMVFPEASLGRSMGSQLFFLAFCAAGYVLARTADLMPGAIFDRMIRLCFYFLLLCAVAGALQFSPFSAVAAKAVLIFMEPSHYSLSFMPFLYYFIITATPARRQFWAMTGFAIALVLQSLTLMVGTAIIVIAIMPARHVALLTPLFVGALVYLGFDYYADRLDFSEGSSNLSTLYFLSGWERAYLNFVETYGLGVGFQQFGVIGSPGKISALIVQLAGERMGVLDGGSMGAKFVGEFGLFGILLLLVYARLVLGILRIYRALSKTALGTVSPQWVFATSCIVAFSIDIFVRGIAYFSPSGLLFVSSLFWLAGDRFARRSWPGGAAQPVAAA